MLDISIIILYLILTLAYGIYRGRGIKDFKDYAVGKGNIGMFALTATIAATLIGGGGTIGDSRLFYSFGAICLFGNIFEAVKYWISAKWIIPRFLDLKPVGEALTLGDILGYYFGDFGKCLVGICATSWTIGIVGAQIGAIGFIFEHFFQMPHELGAIAAFAVLITYSALGGIKSVVATDIIQFILLVIAVPMMCGFAISKAGGIHGLVANVPAEHFSLFPSKELVLMFIPIYLTYMIPDLSPGVAQRMLISNNKHQIIRSFFISGTLLIPVGILILLISFSARTLFPELDAHLVFPAVIDNLLPVGIKGIAVAGLLAIIMSTADSILNAGSISFVHDLVKPISSRKNLNELKITRGVTIATGFIALFIALRYKSLFDIVRFSYVFWDAAIMPPFLVLVFGYRPSKKTLIFTSCISIPLALFAALFEEEIGFSCVFLCTLLNLCLLLTYDRKNLKKPVKIKKFTRSFTNKTKAFLAEQKDQVMHALSSRHYSFIFISNALCFAYVATFYLLITALVGVNLTIHSYIFILSGLLATMIVFTGEFLPAKIRKKLPILWACSIGYNCVFLSTSFLIKVGAEHYGVINFLISIFMLLMVMDWRSSLILSAISIFASIIVQGVIFPEAVSHDNIQWILILGALIIGIIATLIVRGKEILEQEKERSLKAFTGILAHELRTPLQTMSALSLHLQKAIQKGELQTTKAHQKTLEKHIKTFNLGHRHAHNFINMSLVKLKGETSFSLTQESALTSISNACDQFGLSDRQRNLLKIESDQNDFLININKTHFNNIIFNLLKNAYYFIAKAGEGTIAISLEQGNEYNKIHLTDTGSGIPLEIQSQIFDKFYSQRRNGTGLGLSYCKEIMEAFLGSIEVSSDEGVYTRMTLSFPKQKTDKRIENSKL